MLGLRLHTICSVDMSQAIIQDLQLFLQRQDKPAVELRQEMVHPTPLSQLVNLYTFIFFQSKADQTSGGHLRPAVYSRILSYTKQFGLEAAVEVANFEFDHVPALAALVEEEKIDCDFTLTKSFDIYTDILQAKTAKKYYNEFKAAGIAKHTMDDLIWTDAEHAEEVSAAAYQSSYK
jgi:hypothetical protein